MSDHMIYATNGAGSTQPLAVAGYNANRETRTIVHDLLDGTIGVSHIPPRPRAGNLVTVYTDRVQAFAAYTLYAAESPFGYENTALPELNMYFVVAGALDIDSETVDEEQTIWYVRVGFQEV